MKYPYKIYAVIVLFLVIMASCMNKEEITVGSNTATYELSFSAVIDEMSTKAAANSFFNTGDSIKVTLQTSHSGSTSQNYDYIYGDDGIFRGSPGYLFSVDDEYIISLEAVWPYDAQTNGGFVSDQRDYENFRKGDWLVATAKTTGIVATDVPVPLLFDHNNCLLEFELVGQNSQGLDIDELLIELEVDGTPTPCYAYCKNENGRASFHLKPGTKLTSQPGELLGVIPGAGGDRYTIILNDINITLEAGKRYLVTLVPQGYDLEAYLKIGGWNDDLETGIGIPFHKPAEGEAGNYIIHTPAQLITMSYLMRHYYDGSTIAWPTLTYTIADDFVLTQEYADMYIPVPRSLFRGKILYQDDPIEELPYGTDQVLELLSDE